MEEINRVRLRDVSGGFDCGLINYGCMRDVIGHFDYEFMPGIYVLKGECATGGWALSTVLSGKDESFEGQIYFNEKEVNRKYISRFSCYVGEDAGLKKCFGLKPKTVREQIEYGINNNLSFTNNIQEIKDKFGLSEGRFNRPIKYFSGERWRASMAIGYAMGKTVYCFPWMNTKFIMHIEECLQLCLKSLLEIGAIIIIPTTKEEAINRITNEYNVINLD